MSSIPRLYGKIFNFSGISIGYGDVFPEIRKYHQQDLMGDEVLVLTNLLYRDSREDTNLFQDLPLGTFFPWKQRLLKLLPDTKDLSVIDLSKLTPDDELPLSIINRDPKLAITPFSFEAQIQFIEYMVSGPEKQKPVTIERYQEIINWITTDMKATTNAEKGRRHRARTEYRVRNGCLYRRNPDGDEAVRVATEMTAFDFIINSHKACLHQGIRKTYALVTERYYVHYSLYHLDHHQRIVYTPEDESIPMEEIDEERHRTSIATEKLQPPSCEFIFHPPGQIASTESTSTSTLPLHRSQLHHLQIDPQLSQQIPTLEPESALRPTEHSMLIFFPPLIVTLGHTAEPNPMTDIFPHSNDQHSPNTVDSSPLSSPASTVVPSPTISHISSIILESQTATVRAKDIIKREIDAYKNNAHARTEMTRKYNNHHHAQSFMIINAFSIA
ncbi:hypothetical protein BDD12DRAFT_808003 [Trichophaea hybrida]|nr:hypothetical protein BDD12DRAFT_808003 [Trichophaea hybrida]